jgi:hypothetical protein
MIAQPNYMIGRRRRLAAPQEALAARRGRHERGGGVVIGRGRAMALVAVLAVIACGCLAARADAFVNWTNTASIGRTNLDGSGVDDSFVVDADFPKGVAVDALPLARSASITTPAGAASLNVVPTAGRPGVWSVSLVMWGSALSFTLNQPATVKLAFTRQASGRVVSVKGHRECVDQTKHNQRRRKCVRTVTAAGLSLKAPSGADKIGVAGRVGPTHKLSLGSYTTTITATNAGGESSAPRSLRFHDRQIAPNPAPVGANRRSQTHADDLEDCLRGRCRPYEDGRNGRSRPVLWWSLSAACAVELAAHQFTHPSRRPS